MNLRVPVLLATALAVTLTAGCGLISAAGNVASVAGTLGDFSERLGKGATGEFSVCVTDAGVLSSFKGSLSTGERGEIVLTRYSTSVDPAAFRPPAGAKIVETVTAPPS